jgi:hypothetical protein
MPDGQEQTYQIKLGGQMYQFKDRVGLSEEDAVNTAVQKYPKFADAYKQNKQTKLNSNPLMGPQGPTSMGAPKPWEPHTTVADMTETAKKEHPVVATVAEGVKRIGEFGELAGKTALALVPPTAGGMAVSKLASMSRAGKVIGEVEAAAEAAHVSVSMHGVQDVVDRAIELDGRGHNAPKVFKDLYTALNSNRQVTAVAGQTGQLIRRLGFQEARDFYQAATKLTPDEIGKASGVMKYQTQQLASKLGERIVEAAGSMGQGPKFAKAMKEYHQMSQLGRAIDRAVIAAIGAGGLTAAVKIIKELVP